MKKKFSPMSHDGIFKRFLTEIEGAKDFFDFHLPQNIKSLCDFSTLALTNSSFIDKQLRSRISDVLYSVQTTKGKGYIYIMIEHQSTADKLMAWRMMHYAFLAMNQHLEQGHKTLPLVVPILFYHGKRSPYPYSQLWTDCFSLPEMANNLYTQPFPLVDVTVMNDDELAKHRKIAALELVLKHRHFRDSTLHIVSNIAQIFNYGYNSENDVYDIVYYIFKTQDSANFEKIVQLLAEQTEKHGEAIMNIAQRLQDKGRQEGIDQGFEQGIEKGFEQGIEKGIEKGAKRERLRAYQRQLEMARNLLKNGVSLELVMESIGLSREELMSLQ